ncbi:MAG: cell division protein SepF [Thermoleophilia bacterium]
MAIGDMWRRTLVYFGMADDPEDDEFYEDEDPPTRARGGSSSSTRYGAADDLERGYRERPNVRRISTPRTSRRDDFDDAYDDVPSRPVMRAVESRPQRSEVHLVVPKNFNDAQQIGDKFKANVPVILNLQSAETDLAKRLIDFSSGLTYALDGGMQRVADKVFMLTPRNVEVSAEERARLLEKGFFNQY